MIGREPETPEEWQEAIDWCSFLLTFHDAKLYGLVDGGPEIDVARCQDLIAQAEARGFTPRPGHIEGCYAALLRDSQRPA